MPNILDSHECYVDCTPIIEHDDAGNVTKHQHMMFTINEPSTAAGRYQYDQNRLIQTRREWRATGQDESRNVRLWNHKRKTHRDYYIVTWNLPKAMPLLGIRSHYRRTGILL